VLWNFHENFAVIKVQHDLQPILGAMETTYIVGSTAIHLNIILGSSHHHILVIYSLVICWNLLYDSKVLNILSKQMWSTQRRAHSFSISPYKEQSTDLKVNNQQIANLLWAYRHSCFPRSTMLKILLRKGSPVCTQRKLVLANGLMTCKKYFKLLVSPN
jgi:hypothetical protein